MPEPTPTLIRRFPAGRLAALLACAVALLAGCRSLAPQPAIPAAAGPLPVGLAESFPSPLRMTHRAILSIRGREFSLSGHLVLDPARGLRLLVLHAFGRVLADVVVEPSGRVRVLRRAAGFRETWARDGLARDAALLFAPGLVPGGPWNRRDTDGGRDWERPLAQAGQQLLIREDATGTGRVLEILGGDATLWRAEGFAARDIPGLASRQPSRFRIQGAGYALDLTVLSAEPATNAAAFFPAADGTVRR